MLRRTDIMGTSQNYEGDRASNALVWGAGGIGSALAKHLVASRDYKEVFLVSRDGRIGDTGATPIKADMFDADEVQAAVEQAAEPGPLSTVIVTTGVLHGDGFAPEKSLRQVSADSLAHVLNVNVIGPTLVAQACIPKMPRKGRAVFAALSARVGSITDNRLGGWHSYRSSKAALNMMLKTISIEWTRTNSDALCVGLHPGTVDTPMSEPFQSGVPDGKLFTPDYSAECLLKVLAGLSPGDTGKVFSYDGAIVPA